MPSSSCSALQSANTAAVLPRTRCPHIAFFVAYLTILPKFRATYPLGYILPTATSASTINATDAQAVVARWTSFNAGTGTCLRTFLILVFYPVARSNFLSMTFGADFHQLIKYHKFVIWFLLFISWLHGLSFMLQWVMEGTWLRNMAYFQLYTDNYIFGVLALAVLTVMFFCSHPWVRKNYFWVFRHTHTVGIVSLIYHPSTCF